MWWGVTDWFGLSEIGAIYPFQGLEWLLTIAAVVFWVWWQIRCIRDENREMDEAAAHYRRAGAERFMPKDGKPHRPE